MNQEVLMALLTGLISIFGIIITKVLVPYIKSKTTENQFNYLQILVETAIFAAEQLFKGNGQGPAKKEYVYNYIKKIMPQLNDEDINLLVEGTGKALNIFN